MRVPDGWRLVPVEPTEAMLDAGTNLDPDQWGPGDLHYIWEVMLAASPVPQAEDAGVGEDAVERVARALCCEFGKHDPDYVPMDEAQPMGPPEWQEWAGYAQVAIKTLASPPSPSRAQAIEEAAQELDNAAYVEECADETAEGTRRGKPWRLAAARVRALQGQQGGAE